MRWTCAITYRYAMLKYPRLSLLELQVHASTPTTAVAITAQKEADGCANMGSMSARSNCFSACSTRLMTVCVISDRVWSNGDLVEKDVERELSFRFAIAQSLKGCWGRARHTPALVAMLTSRQS